MAKPIMRVKKAVLPAAGLGTRFLPATKAQPKEMLPVVDKPLIQYSVEECIASGIENVIIVTGRRKNAIEDHFDLAPELERFLEEHGRARQAEMIRQISGGLHFSYTRQSEALGLGHAVLLARDLVGEEPFAVLLGDVIHDGTVPATKALIDVHQRTGQGAITVEEVPPERVQLYGIVDVEPDSSSGLGDHYMRVRDVIEKPAPDQAPSNLAITGRYVLPSKVFEYIEKTEPGRNGEIQLTDALRLLAKNEGLWVYKYDGSTLDAGDKLGFLRATVEMALKNPELGPSFRNYLKTLKL